MQAVKRKAKCFLDDALAEARSGVQKPPKISKEFSFWMKHADLDSVLQYLSQ